THRTYLRPFGTPLPILLRSVGVCSTNKRRAENDERRFANQPSRRSAAVHGQDHDASLDRMPRSVPRSGSGALHRVAAAKVPGESSRREAAAQTLRGADFADLRRSPKKERLSIADAGMVPRYDPNARNSVGPFVALRIVFRREGGR